MKEIENLETQLDETRTELKRCISRLSYVGMGLSDELDKSLADLRKLVKSDANEKEIKVSIDDISKILRTMEDEPEPKSSQREIAVKEADVIQELLEKKLPVKLKIALNKQVEKSSDSKKTPDPATLIINAIQDFLNQAENNEQINHLASFEKQEQQSKKLGFFARIFGNKTPTIEQEPQNANPSESRNFHIPEELKSSLRHLVEQLSAMETYSQIGTELTSKVERIKLINDLSEILESITGAFVEISGQEHKQFENFLKSLNKRIDRVNDFISNTVNYSQQVKDESGQLDEDLKESVSSMKSSLESSDSITEVKNFLYEKMDLILQRVNTFYEHQEQNHNDLNENIDKLQEQLRATTDESSRLKEDLAAQKIRAQTDPLTQLPNRYSYNEHLTQEYNRWRRYRNSLSLVVGDIDFFKKTNDEYGHFAGDEVLKSLSVFLQNELRESDFIARFGGEEFVILLPETNLIHATKAINKLRRGVKELSIEFEGTKIEVAMSFGIAEFEEDDTPNVVFQRADKALYRAKEKGRDQVCCQRAKKSDS